MPLLRRWTIIATIENFIPCYRVIIPTGQRHKQYMYKLLQLFLLLADTQMTCGSRTPPHPTSAQTTKTPRPFFSPTLLNARGKSIRSMKPAQPGRSLQPSNLLRTRAKSQTVSAGGNWQSSGRHESFAIRPRQPVTSCSRRSRSILYKIGVDATRRSFVAKERGCCCFCRHEHA